MTEPTHCPKCGQAGRILNARTSPVTGTLRRRRICSACAHRWTTKQEPDEPERPWDQAAEADA